jgi:CNT family concentrative nucleoside transporter
MLNLISLTGMAALMAVAWLLSNNRHIVNWRVVLWGTGLQLAMAAFLFAVPAGQRVFLFLNDVVIRLVDVAGEGSRFLFGPLAIPPGAEGSLGFILAFQALPTIVFFAALLGLLYYYRVLPWLIELFAGVFTRWMRISGAESLCVAANIFVGVESSLAVKPYLERMTRSELCTILCSMMCNTASSVLALYVMMLKPTFPNIAGHLVSATLLSAPAGVVMAKLIYPETDQPETLGLKVKAWYDRSSNAITSVITGASDGGKMVFGIVTLLLAVLGLVALVSLITSSAGGWLNHLLGIQVDFSLKGLLGYLFFPFTLLLGINIHDVPHIARLIGERAVITEVGAYQDLAVLLANGVLVDQRSAIIATYALCGFAHIASLGIFIGGIAAIVPSRTKDLAAVGFRALIGATLSCLMMACAAGVFLTGGSVLLGK